MTAARRVADVINAHGEPMTLRLRGEAGDSPEFIATISIRAKRYTSEGRDLVGDLQQRRIRFKMSHDAILAASARNPRKLDTLTAADGEIYVVDDVDTRLDGSTVLIHIIDAVGDA
jgi:hypothetical protein